LRNEKKIIIWKFKDSEISSSTYISVSGNSIYLVDETDGGCMEHYSFIEITNMIDKLISGLKKVKKIIR